MSEDDSHTILLEGEEVAVRPGETPPDLRERLDVDDRMALVWRKDDGTPGGQLIILNGLCSVADAVPDGAVCGWEGIGPWLSPPY